MNQNLVANVFLAFLLLSAKASRAQEPGVDCIPVQGSGWQGCAPIDDGSQQGEVSRPNPEQWINHFGAIATDTKIGALGQATDQLSQGIATTAALADCRSKGGSECKIEIAYVNGCAAMIVGHPGYAIALGQTASEAVRNGMKMCIDGGDTNCHSFYSGCSLPRQIR